MFVDVIDERGRVRFKLGGNTPKKCKVAHVNLITEVETLSLKREPRMGEKTKKVFDSENIAGQEGKIIEGDKILKPLRCGDSEVTAYETFAQVHPDILKLIPEFLGTEWREDHNDNIETKYLVMENLQHKYKKAAIMDIKIGSSQNMKEPLRRTGVANLLGCYVAGVESQAAHYRNRVNGYLGRMVSARHFQRVVHTYFKQVGPQPSLIKRLEKLQTIMEKIR